jgi:hypothetical protein
MAADDIKLSSSTTIRRYKDLQTNGDRRAIAEFIVERFNERYFCPIQTSLHKHGFASMAIACLIIETLESFYQGLTDTKNVSGKMFQDFFQRKTELNVFGAADNWFYKDIRCGILHQAESRGGWRILRSGPLLDRNAKSINATRLVTALQRAVQKYADEVVSDEKVWQNFQRKMAAVCNNCK